MTHVVNLRSADAIRDRNGRRARGVPVIACALLPGRRPLADAACLSTGFDDARARVRNAGSVLCLDAPFEKTNTKRSLRDTAPAPGFPAARWPTSGNMAGLA
jgi:hypothetical protein